MVALRPDGSSDRSSITWADYTGSVQGRASAEPRQAEDDEAAILDRARTEQRWLPRPHSPWDARPADRVHVTASARVRIPLASTARSARSLLAAALQQAVERRRRTSR